MTRLSRSTFAWLLLAFLYTLPVHAQQQADGIFARENLMAWCIVPFDAAKRGPEARAQMLADMGIKKLAYDWRAEHIPTFDEEIEALARHGITLQAFWFPAGLNEDAQAILAALKRHNVKTELWVTLNGGDIECSPEEQAQRVIDHSAIIRPIAEAAAAQGCTVGLYNHGGWFGEPRNQIAIIEALRKDGFDNVGIVYNQHHGHAHVDDFARLLEDMLPYLYAINLNGMDRDGDAGGRKILPIGVGELDKHLLAIIQASRYSGPIGILNHTDRDAETVLLENLTGLERLAPALNEKPQSSSRSSPNDIEDRHARLSMPEFHTIPAAPRGQLTRAIPPSAHYFSSWRRSNGDPHNSRFIATTEITKENVAQLTKVWEYRSGDGAGNLQCNPIVVDRLLIAPTAGHRLVALDAATGEPQWKFEPEGRPAHRGLTYWAGNAQHAERIVVPAGAHIYALNPMNGEPIATFGKGGRISPGVSVVAPVVHENTLILPGLDGDVWAFDVRTGESRWTFHTIPRDFEYGADTWSAPGQGANCWGGMALDERRGIVYVSTGSPKPNFAGNTHHGENLFANCVIALDAKTGERRWHFQEIRHDIWDLDIPAPPNLVSLTADGVAVDAVAQVTKLGNTLLLDRVSGEPLFPFRLRRAPTSALPGERTWPYQPDPKLPEPFAGTEFTLDDVTNRSPEATAFLLNRLASANMGWFAPFEENKATAMFGIHGGAEWTGAAFNPNAGKLFVSANNIPWLITVFQPDPPVHAPGAPPTPGRVVYEQHCLECHGADRFGVGMAPPLHRLGTRVNDVDVRALLRSGRNAMPALPDTVSDDELDALLDYLYLRDASSTVAKPPDATPRYTHNGYPKLVDHEGYPGSKPPWGTLNCLDLASGKLDWQVPLGVYPELAAWGEDETGAENFGGPAVTATGLVFCAGTPDNRIRAFDADTGTVLWEGKLPFGGYAPPTLYRVNNKTHIVIAATGGGKLGTDPGDAYVAFALP